MTKNDFGIKRKRQKSTLPWQKDEDQLGRWQTFFNARTTCTNGSGMKPDLGSNQDQQTDEWKGQ